MFGIFRRPMTVIDPGQGEYVDGIYQPGQDVERTARYSVQPASPQDMEMLPEGRRTNQSFALFGDERIRPADDSEGTNAEQVVIDGERYECMRSEPWQNSIVSHYRMVVTKMAEQPNE